MRCDARRRIQGNDSGGRAATTEGETGGRKAQGEDVAGGKSVCGHLVGQSARGGKTGGAYPRTAAVAVPRELQRGRRVRFVGRGARFPDESEVV